MPERVLQVPRGLEELVRERALDELPDVDRTDGDVHVRVEKAWQQGLAADVDRVVGIGASGWADRDDALTLDDDVRGIGLRAGPVEDLRTGEDGS